MEILIRSNNKVLIDRLATELSNKDTIINLTNGYVFDVDVDWQDDIVLINIDSE